jgi:hypothetical protein
LIVPGGFAEHGIGGAKDLPLPPELAIVGAVAALAVSFGVLALAWREPRYDGRPDGPVRGRPGPGWLSAVVASSGWHVAMRTIGLLFFGFGAFAAVFGQDLLTNPVFGMFYVWWWVGLPVASLLLGPVWRAVSPVRTINALVARVSGGDPERGVFAYSPRAGYWPAALGLLAFVWIELVYTHGTELGPVRLWGALYVAVMLIGGTLFGNTFYEHADPFEVYSTLVSKLSVWAQDADRTLLVRSPLANLSTVEPKPGLVAVVATLFGSTAFDSFRDSTPWVKFIQSSDTSSYLLNNLALVGFCVAVGLVFVAGTTSTGVEPGTRRLALPDQFAHSIVPIVAGYIVAHYLSYLVEVGQQTLIQASDPLSDGSNWFGTAGWSVSYWISYHPTGLATTKVLAVVLGHVVGVVAAHDRALTLLPARHRITGQLPLLLAMVAFTIGGLYLLFAA